MKNNVIAKLPKKAKVIAVLSGKGGVGKTTISTNLATSLSYNYKYDVILIDANTTSAGTSLHLGQYDYPISLNDVLKNKAHVSQAIYKHPSGLRFIPASTSINNLEAKPTKLKKVVKELEQHVDYIILDCSPTLGEESIAGIDSCDEAIIISNPDWASLLEAKRTIEFIKKKKKKILGLIINKAKSKNSDFLKKVQSSVEIPILGVVREDEKIKREVELRAPVIHAYPYSSSSKDLQKILEKITKKPYNKRLKISKKIKLFLG